MDTGRRGVLAWEDLWIRRVGIAALVGSLLALLGFVLLQSSIGGSANFEGLREAHESSTQISLSGLATGIGYVLLSAPLFFPGGSVAASVRNQLIGLAILGPLLLGVSGLCSRQAPSRPRTPTWTATPPSRRRKSKKRRRNATKNARKTAPSSSPKTSKAPMARSRRRPA